MSPIKCAYLSSARSYDENDIKEPGSASAPLRESPPPSSVLGVFGLSPNTTEQTLEKVFGEFGTVTLVKIIYDKDSSRSRGYAFVTFERQEDATVALDKMNGIVTTDILYLYSFFAGSGWEINQS